MPHFTDSQRGEQLLPCEEVVELGLTHQASPVSWMSLKTCHSTLPLCAREVKWLFFNVSSESFKGKLTNSHSFFKSPIKGHFPRETSSSEAALVPHTVCCFHSTWYFSFRALITSVVIYYPFETTSPPPFAV